MTTSRARSLADDDITALLRVGPVEIVVDVGHAARWIHLGYAYRFWKSEAKLHLAAGAEEVPADFPDGYCYFGSQWNRGESGPPIVVREKSH